MHPAPGDSRGVPLLEAKGSIVAYQGLQSMNLYRRAIFSHQTPPTRMSPPLSGTGLNSQQPEVVDLCGS